jgi:hypothetical protein
MDQLQIKIKPIFLAVIVIISCTGSSKETLNSMNSNIQGQEILQNLSITNIPFGNNSQVELNIINNLSQSILVDGTNISTKIIKNAIEQTIFPNNTDFYLKITTYSNKSVVTELFSLNTEMFAYCTLKYGFTSNGTLILDGSVNLGDYAYGTLRYGLTSSTINQNDFAYNTLRYGAYFNNNGDDSALNVFSMDAISNSSSTQNQDVRFQITSPLLYSYSSYNRSTTLDQSMTNSYWNLNISDTNSKLFTNNIYKGVNTTINTLLKYSNNTLIGNSSNTLAVVSNDYFPIIGNLRGTKSKNMALFMEDDNFVFETLPTIQDSFSINYNADEDVMNVETPYSRLYMGKVLSDAGSGQYNSFLKVKIQRFNDSEHFQLKNELEFFIDEDARVINLFLKSNGENLRSRAIIFSTGLKTDNIKTTFDFSSAGPGPVFGPHFLKSFSESLIYQSIIRVKQSIIQYPIYQIIYPPKSYYPETTPIDNIILGPGPGPVFGPHYQNWFSDSYRPIIVPLPSVSPFKQPGTKIDIINVKNSGSGINLSLKITDQDGVGLPGANVLGQALSGSIIPINVQSNSEGEADIYLENTLITSYNIFAYNDKIPFGYRSISSFSLNAISTITITNESGNENTSVPSFTFVALILTVSTLWVLKRKNQFN